MTQVEPTAFLYPFIEADERDAAPLLADLARSANEKIAASRALQGCTLAAQAGAITAAAQAMAARFAAGGRLLAFGNGGSAMDAAAAARRFASDAHGRALPATSLVSDLATLTALANDVGFDTVFARQVEARGRAGDIALGISTSGGSANVRAGLAMARRRGLLTVGVSGYGGGALAASGGVDHVIVVDSDSVHRIEEAQDAVLRTLCAVVREVFE